MKRGALLILDEIDRGSNKLMCLQAILEGKPYFNKKSGEVIQPQPVQHYRYCQQPSRGSDDGKFMGAQVLDEDSIDSQSRLNRNTLLLLKRKKSFSTRWKCNCVDDEFADKLVTC